MDDIINVGLSQLIPRSAPSVLDLKHHTHTHTHHVVSESFSGRRTHRSVLASRSERGQVGRFPSAQQKRLDEFPSFHENHIKNDPLLTEQTGAENQEFESRRETPPADTPWPGQPSSTRDL